MPEPFDPDFYGPEFLLLYEDVNRSDRELIRRAGRNVFACFVRHLGDSEGSSEGTYPYGSVECATVPPRTPADVDRAER